MTSTEEVSDFKYESHPIADIFPMMDGPDLENLTEGIKANGVVHPVMLYEDKILDGRNRYKIATELGVTCPFEPYSGDDPLGFVLRENLQRRNLTDKQRVEVAAKMANLTNGQHAAKGAPPNGGAKKTSVKQAAERMNVPVRSVERERKNQCDKANKEVAVEKTSKPKEKKPKGDVVPAKRETQTQKDLRWSLKCKTLQAESDRFVARFNKLNSEHQRVLDENAAMKTLNLKDEMPRACKWASKPLTHVRYSGDNWGLDESYDGLLRQYKDQSFEFEELQNTLEMTIDKLHRKSIILKRKNAELKREIEKLKDEAKRCLA